MGMEGERIRSGNGGKATKRSVPEGPCPRQGSKERLQWKVRFEPGSVV